MVRVASEDFPKLPFGWEAKIDDKTGKKVYSPVEHICTKPFESLTNLGHARFLGFLKVWRNSQKSGEFLIKI